MFADELQPLLEDGNNEWTNNEMGAAKEILLEYGGVMYINMYELLTLPKEEICCFLINFYSEIQKGGYLYSRSSMISIIFGL